MRLTALIILSVMLAGCSSTKDSGISRIVQDYYAQPRTYKTVQLSGASEVVIRGTNIVLVMENQLSPLSVYPRGESTLSKVIDGAVRLGTVAGGKAWQREQ